MSKKKDSRQVFEPAVADRFGRDEVITDTLEKNYMPYAMSVIVSRAIPEIDGFKPAHRKILYTMYKMNLLRGDRTKSANIVGQTMKLHPHGDQAIYETMVRMTAGNEALLHPYVDSKGNFGKQYSRDMQCAAPRYTEAALQPICRELFAAVDKDAVDLVDNYDGTLKEPTLFPVTFPSILVNSNQGIAVGMASNICSFNLKEVCAATAAYIDDAEADITDYMPAPDFSGGGELIYDREQIKQIYQTGRGSFKIRARYRYDKKNRVIEVYEIPYTTTVEQIIDDLAKQVKAGQLKDINDVRDETDKDGLKLAIEIKRQADPEALMQRLYGLTALESSFACNFNLLVKGQPVVLGVKDIIHEWLSFRRSCLKREIGFDLAAARDRLHLLSGLEKILLDIDRAIKIIRETEAEEEVVPNLCAGFEIDRVQAEYVAEIKLRHLNRQYILRRTADLATLREEIGRLEKKLNSSKLIDGDIKADLKRVADLYGQPRRTSLVKVAEIEPVTKEDLIDDFRLKAFLTRDGYLKKLALTSLRSAGELRTKEEDVIIQEVETGNAMEVIFLTDRHNAYKSYFYEFENQKPSELGAYLPNVLDMEPDERILKMIVPGEDYAGSVLFAFENGKVARIPLSTYQTKNKRSRLVNAYSDSSPLAGMVVLQPAEGETVVPEADCLIISDTDKAALFTSDLVGEKQTRTTVGVQVLSGKRRGKVTGFSLLSEVSLQDPEYYRIRKIPSVGYYLKEGVGEQLSLDQLQEG